MRAFRRENVENKDVTLYDPAKAYNGYTFFSTMYGQDAWLIDMNGRVVNHWVMEHMPGPYGHLLPNGNVLWQGRGPNTIEGFGGNATEIVEVDWDGNEVWRHDDPLLNHDWIRLENGNTIVNRYLEIPEDIAVNIKGGVPNSKKNGKVYSCSFQEITRDKEVVWEWKHYEHLSTETDVLCPLCPESIWGYTNAMDVFPNGNILFTLRFLNTVCILDKTTGEIIWRWGPGQGIGHPHDCSVLPNGNILVFDNGFHKKGSNEEDADISELEYSRVLEVDVKTGDIVWQYYDKTHFFYTTCCGGCQRLPNGNTLICESLRGRFFEVTPEKDIVWQYENPFLTTRPPSWPEKQWDVSNETFRCLRYSADFEGFKGKDLDPDKFEFVIQKKAEKSDAEKAKEAAYARLTKLGY